jgi:hypothetical protein
VGVYRIFDPTDSRRHLLRSIDHRISLPVRAAGIDPSFVTGNASGMPMNAHNRRVPLTMQSHECPSFKRLLPSLANITFAPRKLITSSTKTLGPSRRR